MCSGHDHQLFKIFGVWFSKISFRRVWWLSHISIARHHWTMPGLTVVWASLQIITVRLWYQKIVTVLVYIWNQFYLVISRIWNELEWWKIFEIKSSIETLGFLQILGKACRDHSVDFQNALTVDMRICCNVRRYTYGYNWNLLSIKRVSHIPPPRIMKYLSKTACWSIRHTPF